MHLETENAFWNTSFVLNLEPWAYLGVSVSSLFEAYPVNGSVSSCHGRSSPPTPNTPLIKYPYVSIEIAVVVIIFTVVHRGGVTSTSLALYGSHLLQGKSHPTHLISSQRIIDLTVCNVKSGSEWICGFSTQALILSVSGLNFRWPVAYTTVIEVTL